MPKHNHDFEDFLPTDGIPIWDGKVEPTEVIAVIGQRRSGKSVLVAEVLLKIRRLFPKIMVISKTKHNGYWQQFVPNDKIFPEWDEARMEMILELQTKISKEYRQTKKGNPVLTILADDVMTDDLLRKSGVATTIVFNGRHHYFNFWLLIQDHIGMNRAQRKNVDRYIIMQAADAGIREMIRKTWPGALELVDKVTSEKKHQALVINNKANCDPKDRYSKYLADYDYIQKQIKNNAVLGNQLWWQNSDVKTQKKLTPCVDLPCTETLMANFNTVPDRDDEETLDEMQAPEGNEVEQPSPDIVVTAEKVGGDSYEF